jgi:ABC-type branched-subunit amino acid transport system permease subunit
MAVSHGVVTLGIVLLMRGGVVSFGQGLVFAAGGYAAALASNRLGITDVFALLAAWAGWPPLRSPRPSRHCSRATGRSSSRC